MVAEAEHVLMAREGGSAVGVSEVAEARAMAMWATAAEAVGVGPLGVTVAEATLVAALAVDVGYGAEEAVVVAVGGAAAGRVALRAARFSVFRSFFAVAIMAATPAE